MRLAIVGRTKLLVAISRRLISDGHAIGLVVTTGDADAVAPFIELAASSDAVCLETKKINTDDVREIMRASRCELAVSLNWITLIGPETLACFRRGFLNGHAGDLPRYRGNACPNWAILQGEAYVGLCVHEMAAELDAGAIYERASLPLTSETYITDVQNWINFTAPELFSLAIRSIARGQKPTKQPEDRALALRCYPRHPQDSRIYWWRPASEIHRLIRASSRPFEGAFCFLKGRKVTVWRGDVVTPESGHLAMPGQPCEPLNGDPLVACGEGFLRLTDVMIEGFSCEASKALINRSVRVRLT